MFKNNITIRLFAHLFEYYCSSNAKIFEIITLETVTKFLTDSSLNLEPSQDKVSFPILERIHRRLSNGKKFNPIKVVNGKISDGHHRFICLSILGIDVATIDGTENTTHKVSFKWSDMTLETIDYDTPEEIEAYAKEYDL